MTKTEEKQYNNLNIPLEDVELEVINYLQKDDKIKNKVVVEKIDNLVWFYASGFAVIIKGSRDDFTIKAGPINVPALNAFKAADLELSFGRMVYAERGLDELFDKNKTAYLTANLFKHLDERFRILNSAEPENSVQNNTDADIPKKIEVLVNLHQRGFLSDEEFKNKKMELLSRL